MTCDGCCVRTRRRSSRSGEQTTLSVARSRHARRRRRPSVRFSASHSRCSIRRPEQLSQIAETRHATLLRPPASPSGNLLNKLCERARRRKQNEYHRPPHPSLALHYTQSSPPTDATRIDIHHRLIINLLSTFAERRATSEKEKSERINILCETLIVSITNTGTALWKLR